MTKERLILFLLYIRLVLSIIFLFNEIFGTFPISSNALLNSVSQLLTFNFSCSSN